MDAASFTPRFRIVLGAVTSAALLVPLAVYGAPAIAKSASSASHQYRSSCHQYGSSGGEYGSSGGQYGSSGGQYGSSCRQYRVQICHRRHSRKHPWRLITVSSRAAKAHLRHGDTFPPCSFRPFAKKHGKGHEHVHGEQGKHGKHGDAGSKHDRD
jgi:hypothetical protein